MNDSVDNETLLLRDLNELDPLGCKHWRDSRENSVLYYESAALPIILELSQYAPKGGRDTVAYVIASVIRRFQCMKLVTENSDRTVSDVVRCLGVADRFIARREGGTDG